MKKVVIILAITLIGMVSANAQKVGHINIPELVSQMPESKSAETTLTSEFDSKKAAIDKAQKDFETKAQAFETKVGNMSQTDIQTQAQALQTEQQQLQQELQKLDELRAKAQQEMVNRQNELLEPIQEKALSAIDAVAKSKGLEYVLDTSSGAIVFANGTDILPDVLKHLGIK